MHADRLFLSRIRLASLSALYAGGLGFLAGDHLKECRDLGVPIVGVGFMYPEGYLRQRIRVDGWQEHVDEPLERGSAPIQRVLDGQKRQLVVKVPFMDIAMRLAGGPF